MTWKLAGASARGSSHQRSGRPNQDAFEHGVGAKDSPLRAVLAVSDGHGGATHFRSDAGSRLAAHVAISVLQQELGRHLEEEHGAPISEAGVQAMLGAIVESWRAAVASDLEHNPFTPEEWSALESAEGATGRAAVEQDPLIAYGATLLAAAAADSFVLFLQLGDGDILAVGPDGTTYRPIEADERLMGNQTTSLCQSGAVEEFRWAMADDPAQLAAVLASTDGYANSFRSEKDFLQIGGDYLKITREDGIHSLAEELPTILAEASEKGSGDDITLAMMINSSIHAVADATKDLSGLITQPKPGATKTISQTKALNTVAATPTIKRSDPVLSPPAPIGSASAKAPPPRSEAQPAYALALKLAFVVALVSAGGWYYKTHSGQTTKTVGSAPSGSKGAKPGTPAASGAAPSPGVEKPVITNPAPEGLVWAIAFPAGSAKTKAANRIPLKVGSEISLRELMGASGWKAVEAGEGSAPYAKVVRDDRGNLCLSNLSGDVWSVALPGKQATEPPADRGTNVVLVNHAKINFRTGIVASIVLADDAPASGASK